VQSECVYLAKKYRYAPVFILIGGLSAHADQAKRLAWHAKTGDPKTTFLVHGEEESIHVSFAKKLHDTEVKMPKLQQSFEL